jgi:hypothetical protein
MKRYAVAAALCNRAEKDFYDLCIENGRARKRSMQTDDAEREGV